MPLRTFAFGRDRRHVDEIVFGAVRAHAAGAQIDHAFGGIEQPYIRVPLVGGGSETPVGSCQPFNCGDGLRAHQFLCRPCLVAFGRRRAADHPHAVEDGKGIVELPAHAVVTQPLAPFRDVAQIVGVQLGEAQRERVVGERANIDLGPSCRAWRAGRSGAGPPPCRCQHRCCCPYARQPVLEVQQQRVVDLGVSRTQLDQPCHHLA